MCKWSWTSSWWQTSYLLTKFVLKMPIFSLKFFLQTIAPLLDSTIDLQRTGAARYHTVAGNRYRIIHNVNFIDLNNSSGRVMEVDNSSGRVVDLHNSSGRVIGVDKSSRRVIAQTNYRPRLLNLLTSISRRTSYRPQ